jgi:hypothetical protein
MKQLVFREEKVSCKPRWRRFLIINIFVLAESGVFLGGLNAL